MYLETVDDPDPGPWIFRQARELLLPDHPSIEGRILATRVVVVVEAVTSKVGSLARKARSSREAPHSTQRGANHHLSRVLSSGRHRNFLNLKALFSSRCPRTGHGGGNAFVGATRV